MQHVTRLFPCRMLRDSHLRHLLAKDLVYLPETIFEDEGLFWIDALNEATETVAVPLSCLHLSERQIEELKQTRHLPERAFKNSLLTKDFYIPESLEVLS